MTTDLIMVLTALIRVIQMLSSLRWVMIIILKIAANLTIDWHARVGLVLRYEILLE